MSHSPDLSSSREEPSSDLASSLYNLILRRPTLTQFTNFITSHVGSTFDPAAKKSQNETLLHLTTRTNQPELTRGLLHLLEPHLSPTSRLRLLSTVNDSRGMSVLDHARRFPKSEPGRYVVTDWHRVAQEEADIHKERNCTLGYVQSWGDGQRGPGDGTGSRGQAPVRRFVDFGRRRMRSDAENDSHGIPNLNVSKSAVVRFPSIQRKNRRRHRHHGDLGRFRMRKLVRAVRENDLASLRAMSGSLTSIPGAKLEKILLHMILKGFCDSLSVLLSSCSPMQLTELRKAKLVLKNEKRRSVFAAIDVARKKKFWEIVKLLRAAGFVDAEDVIGERERRRAIPNRRRTKKIFAEKSDTRTGFF